jgi:hypothetical protein
MSPQREPAATQHADGNVRFCSDINSGGHCLPYGFTNGKCFSLPKHDALNDQLSTFQLNINVECTLFK